MIFGGERGGVKTQVLSYTKAVFIKIFLELCAIFIFHSLIKGFWLLGSLNLLLWAFSASRAAESLSLYKAWIPLILIAACYASGMFLLMF